MSTIQIGGNQRPLHEAEPQWINQQINARRREGQPVCVQINISGAGANLRLATPTCVSAGGGGGRRPNRLESEIFELWERMGLNESDFPGGKVVAFIKQLEGLLDLVA